MLKNLAAMQDRVPVSSGISCMAVNFPSISGTGYPAWLSSISGTAILNGCELFGHLWDSLPCVAAGFSASFSCISGIGYPAWLWTFQTCLGQPVLHGCELCNHFPDSLSCMAVNFSSSSRTAWLRSISGAAYSAWLRAFKSSLGQLILHGCELFNHLWESRSCMAVSFSSISGKGYPAWLSAF